MTITFMCKIAVHNIAKYLYYSTWKRCLLAEKERGGGLCIFEIWLKFPDPVFAKFLHLRIRILVGAAGAHTQRHTISKSWGEKRGGGGERGGRGQSIQIWPDV